MLPKNHLSEPVSYRFYLCHVLILCLLAILLIALDRYTNLDFLISDWFYNPQTQRFPLQDNFWTVQINHKLFKYCIIAGILGSLLWGIKQRNKRLVFACLSAAIASAIVNFLKSQSAHSCPWDLIQYGGHAEFFHVFSTPKQAVGPGHCFPGGHVSAGFALLCFYFYFYPIDSGKAKFWLAASLLIGSILGLGQIARGAHLLSHNLWSMWVCWATIAALFFIYEHGFLKRR